MGRRRFWFTALPVVLLLSLAASGTITAKQPTGNGHCQLNNCHTTPPPVTTPTPGPTASPGPNVSTWNPVANGDSTITGWTKETGSGTPIFGEVDEGTTTPDNTGVKATSPSANTPSFTLSDTPSDFNDVTLIDPTGTWGGPTTMGAMNDVATDGNGMWVAVGNSGALYYSTDPTTGWTSNTQGTTNWKKVAYGNGVWVAASTDAYIYATDPTGTWTTHSGLTGANVFALAYLNTYWLMFTVTGGSIKLEYSTDPSSGFTANSQTFATGGTAPVGGVAYGATHYVFAASTGGGGVLLFYTTDPTGTWTNNSTNMPLGGPQGVAYGNGYFVAVGVTGGVAYATDPTGAWTSNSFSAPDFYSVVYALDTWVIVGGNAANTVNGTYYQSSVPTGTWTSNAQGSLRASGIAVSGGLLVQSIAGGAGALAHAGSGTTGPVSGVTFVLRHKQSGRSDDGMTWNVRIKTSTGTILAAADSGGTFQSVGADAPFNTSYINNSAVTFGYVNTGALKSAWDDAVVEFDMVRTQSMSADTITWFIDSFDINVTYVATGGGGGAAVIVDPMGAAGFFGA